MASARHANQAVAPPEFTNHLVKRPSHHSRDGCVIEERDKRLPILIGLMECVTVPFKLDSMSNGMAWPNSFLSRIRNDALPIIDLIEIAIRHAKTAARRTWSERQTAM